MATKTPIIGSDEVAIHPDEVGRIFEAATGKKGMPQFVDGLPSLPPETYQLYSNRQLLDRFMDGIEPDRRVLEYAQRSRHIKPDEESPITQKHIMLALMERMLKEQAMHLQHFPGNHQRERELMYHLAKNLPEHAREPQQATAYSRAVLNLVGKAVNNHVLSSQKAYGDANTALVETNADMVRRFAETSEGWQLYMAMLERAMRNGFGFLGKDSRDAAKYILGDDDFREREWTGIVQRATEVLYPVLARGAVAGLQEQAGKLPYSMVSGDNSYVLDARKNSGNSLIIPNSDVQHLLQLGAAPTELADTLAARYGFSKEDALRLLFRVEKAKAGVSINYPVIEEGGRFLGFEPWHPDEPVFGEGSLDILGSVMRAGRFIPSLAQKRKYEPKTRREAKPQLYMAFDPSLPWEPWSAQDKGAYDTFGTIAAKLGTDALGKGSDVYVQGRTARNADQLELALVRRSDAPINPKDVGEFLRQNDMPVAVFMVSDITKYKKLGEAGKDEGAVAVFYTPHIDHYDTKGKPVQTYKELRAVRYLSDMGVTCVPVFPAEGIRGVELKVVTK